jgi:predicted MFS family arabinose efflux permease
MPSVDLRSPFRMLRRTPDLRLLLSAGLVSLTGDYLLGIGLAYSVYALTGSTLASAAALLSSFVPQVVLGSVAGVFVDRWDRRRTMVVANLVLAAGLLPLLLVRTDDQIWLVYVVLAVESSVEVFFAPAEQAMLPRVVSDADLVVANGLNGQVQNLARLVGSGLGGVVAAAGGIRAIAAVDAVTFLVAALLVLRIRTSGRVERPAQDAEEAAASAVQGRVAELAGEWRDGFRATWHSPVVRMLVVFSLITATGEGVMGTLFAPYVRHVLDGSAQWYGVISGVQAIGGLAGGVLVASVAARWSPVLMLGLGAVLFGLVDLAIFLYPLLLVTPWPAAVGMVLVGLPGAVVVAGFQTLLQRNTFDAERGRVFALRGLAVSVSVVVGSLLAGFLGGAVGIMPVLAFQGVGYVVAGLLMLVTLDRRAEQAILEPAGPSLDLPGARS